MRKGCRRYEEKRRLQIMGMYVLFLSRCIHMTSSKMENARSSCKAEVFTARRHGHIHLFAQALVVFVLGKVEFCLSNVSKWTWSGMRSGLTHD